MQSQFFADGVGVEQSPTYTAFTLEMLAFAALILKGTPESTRLDPDALLRPATTLRSFLNDKGHAPNIGDNDETRVIAGPLGPEPRYIASVLAAIAGLSETAEIAPPVHDTHIRDFVFGSIDARPIPEARLVTFVHGGYTIYHGTAANHRVHVVFDHGQLGFGTIAAHGHADALALWLSIDGHAVLADTGTYLYYSAGGFRDALRSTVSHNTLQVNSSSQSEPAGAFNWSRKADSRIISVASSVSGWEVEGEHDGYEKDYGVIHNRRVSYDGKALTIVDRLEGFFDQVDACVGFLLDPHLVVEQDGSDSFMIRRGENLLSRFIFSGSSVTAGSISVSKVLFSPRFNEILTTNRVSVSVVARPDDLITTRIEILSVKPIIRDTPGRVDTTS